MIGLQRLRLILSLKGRLSSWIEARAGPLGGYAVAAALVAVALGLRLWMTPWIAGAQFITFFPAVILATLLCGTAAGLAAALLATVAGHYLLSRSDFTIQEANSLLLFFAVALVDVAIISMMLAANAALQASVERIEHLNASLGVSEARFRNLLENAPDAMLIVDGQERIVLVNAEAEKMFGYARADMLGQPIDLLMPERFRGQHHRLMPAFVADPRVRRMGYGRELFGQRRDGTEFPIETNLSLLSGGTGGLVASAIRDITARRDAEERQGLLIRELNHRVKNALASVQAIVSHTLSTAGGAQAFSEALTARLGALSQSHDVLTRNEWSGAEIGDLVSEQLRPYGAWEDGRFRVGGPSVKLAPNRAVTLGMLLGELATNAAKYGALSVDAGEVSVVWDVGVDDGISTVHLVWSESGGPPVRRPKTPGFGTRLIERSSTSGLGGSARLDFKPGGVTCRIDFPLQAGEA
jgi:PAS domain S-box-containing protein